MKWTKTRQGIAALLAGVLLAGGAWGITQGDSLISLSYLNDKYIPTLVSKGSDEQDKQLLQAYDTAMRQLDQARANREQLGGELYSSAFQAQNYVRGDQLVLETGSGFLLLSGAVTVEHNGAFIDVTAGTEVTTRTRLTPGHRYLAAENTSVLLTVDSGLARGGVQGSYHMTESGLKPAPFTDVMTGDWFSQAVDYVYFNGLFAGMGDDTFAPGSKMDRSMMMTVLFHLAGSPEEERLAARAAFKDVPADAWYATFVSWAAEHGVSAGTGDEMFSPAQPVTRQQVVVLLHNFAIHYMGLELTERSDYSSCGDADQVAFWAAEPVSWAMGCGVMTPSAQGLIEPERSATRAEVASMLMNFSGRYLD